MNINFNIFISHDNQDETIAIELKNFLENIFLNSNVYVSGRDLEGGQTWIENIKLSLKSSQVVITLISKKSISNNWIYFETGAGFIEDKSIPLICDGITFNQLKPPISLLQSRMLNESGIKSLVKDIAKKLNLRAPDKLNNIENLLNESENFLSLRRKEEKNEEIVTPKTNNSKNSVKNNNKQGINQEVLEYYNKTENRLKNLIISKLEEKQKTEKNIPPLTELKNYSIGNLSEIARTFQIKTPSTANLNLMMLNLDMPKENDMQWKIINAMKNLEEANSDLDKYEK